VTAKRLFDLIVSLALLALFSPIMLATALCVRLALGPGVLFRQKRPGLYGRPFTILKFRTMRAGPGTDAQRLTPFGRFLRATSLDELPELLNVLRGEMSLVGPRPLLLRYLSLYTREQMRRHEALPGITGLAQVSGRNALSWEERFALDVWYVDHRTFRLDLVILARTVAAVFTRRGIHAEGAATMPEFTGIKPGLHGPDPRD